MKRWIAITLLVSSCMYPGDGGFLATGIIVDQHSRPLENCLVSLRSESGGVLRQPVPVASSFEEFFLVSPYRAAYAINIECPGAGTANVLVHYGRDVGPGKPLKLGRFVVPQQSE